MKYKTLFRLALKVIGVYMIATAVPNLSTLGFQVIEMLFGQQYRVAGIYAFGPTLVFGVSALLAIAIGLYLFFGGRWIVDRAIPSNRPYCVDCGYELSGLPADGICPECGHGYRLSRPADATLRQTADPSI